MSDLTATLLGLNVTVWLVLIYLEIRRSNRILNQVGYHIVELHNRLERLRVQHDKYGNPMQWDSWQDM